MMFDIFLNYIIYLSLLKNLNKAPNVYKQFAATASVAFILGGGNVLPSNAANYGNFGGAYAEVVDPKDVQYSDNKNSEDARAGLEALKAFKSSVTDMKADLTRDNNVELTLRVKKELPVGKVRNSLNKYNSMFTEDTQRGTDRLIRSLVQDLTELERETAVKAGKSRSEAKTNTVLKRLTAAEDALAGLEAFSPK